MRKEIEEEKVNLTDEKRNKNDIELHVKGNLTDKPINSKKVKKKSKRLKKSKKKDKNEDSESEEEKEIKEKEVKKHKQVNDQFIINQRYYLIKMLGSGSFGEIHLAFDSQEKRLNAIKFVK